MKQYIVADKKQTGLNTTALYMRPIKNSDVIAYSSGQYVGVRFRRGKRWTPMRCFSAITAPSDTGELGIAFRSTGVFTSALSELIPGSQIDITGPFGNFTIPRDETRPLMFLAGGIGITPFLSILRDLELRRNPQPVTLLFSTNSLQDVPFARELMDLAKRNQNYTVRFLASDIPADKLEHPSVVQGRLSEEIIKQYATIDTQYYICGPGGYSSAALTALGNMGIHDWAIHNEAFSQSSKMTIAGFAVQKLVYGLLGAAIIIGAGLFTVKDLLNLRETTPVSSATSQANNTTATPTASTNTTTQSTYSSNANQQYYYTPPHSTMS